jgi:hypothetical protein
MGEYKIVIKFLIVHAIFCAGIFSLTIYSYSAISSYVLLAILCFITIAVMFPVFIATYFPKYGSRITLVILCIFLSRLFIGLIHYLLIHPNYFDNSIYFASIYEFEWMHEMMKHFSDGIQNGESVIELFQTTYGKNKELHIYNSIIYKGLGDYSLNISIWNSLHNAYTGLFVSIMALFISKSEKIAFRTIIIFAIYPFILFSDAMDRTAVGQSFVALAALLLIIAKNKGVIHILILTPIVCLMGRMMREPYFLLFLVASFSVLYGKLKQKNRILLVLFIIVILTLFRNIFDFIYALTFFRWDLLSYLTGALSGVFTNVIISITGPFPFYQYFYKVPGYDYQIPSYFLTITNWVLIYVLIIFRHSFNDYRLLIFLGLGFYIIALFSPGLHIDYSSFGFIFFIPFVASKINLPLSRYLSISFIIYVLLTMAYFTARMITIGKPINL